MQQEEFFRCLLRMYYNINSTLITLMSVRQFHYKSAVVVKLLLVAVVVR